MLCPDQSQHRIQFIDGSIGLDADVIFPDPRTTEKSRFTGVSCSRIDFHRLVTRSVEFERASLPFQWPFFEVIHSTFHGKGLYYEQIIGIY